MRIKYDENHDCNIDVSVNLSKEYNGRSKGKTVVYIWGQPSPKDLYPDVWDEAAEDLLDKESNVKGSKIWKKYNRAEVEIMQRAFKIAQPEIERQLVELAAENKYDGIKTSLCDEDGTPYKYVFDRKAGCSCGCSPGFRLKTQDYQTVRLLSRHSYKEMSIHVHLATDAELREEKIKKAKGAVDSAQRKRSEIDKQITQSYDLIRKLKTQRSEFDEKIKDLMDVEKKVKAENTVDCSP